MYTYYIPRSLLPILRLRLFLNTVVGSGGDYRGIANYTNTRERRCIICIIF